MDSLNYSVDALDAKGLFYNKTISVYVEGDDDVLFWNYLFGLSEVNAHIEDVGGDKEIDKYISQILNEGAKFLVACDSHHQEFLEVRQEHPQIISTYGYSIENSMYNFFSINDIVNKLGKGVSDVKNEIEKWVAEFTNQLNTLLIYDIANNRFNKGISIFGDNCSRFLKSPSSHLISLEKVDSYITQIKANFLVEELLMVEELVRQSEKPTWFLIKGHFLTNATINAIRYLVKTTHGKEIGSISHDMLYSLTINVTENWSQRIDISSVVAKINATMAA